jgi:predicted lipoprotein with Yx(FWY)xxD motif
MRTRRRLLTTAIVLATAPFAVAMAASAATAAPAVPAAHATGTSASGAAATTTTVITTEHTKFGTVLVTGTGESLYTFSGDNFPFAATGLQLDCTALNKAPNGTPCTTAWPPLTASSVVARGGVLRDKLGTVTRNGVTQVTYFGKPLYGFIGDGAPNDVNGEDVAAFDGTWYLNHANGRPAVETPTVTTEVSPNGVILSSPTASGTRSLYLLTTDTSTSATCKAAGGCDALWPPLLTNARAKAGTGASRGLIGTVRRSDGTLQVTYRGHPVYFFALDLAAGATPGEINGEHIEDPAPVNGVWYTLLPSGLPAPGSATIGSESSGGTSILADAGAVNGVTSTLYEFTADTPTASHCTGECARFWPPVLTQTAPSAAMLAKGSLLGVIQRPDGTFQVTYDGHPLYYFANALDSGTEGNGVTAFGGTFYTVNVSGAIG